MQLGVDLQPDTVRRWLLSQQVRPDEFRAALTRIPHGERDQWLDEVFDLGELPDDDPDLPRGCVPYLPCSVNTLLQVIELAEVRADDVFVDVGSGMGRAVTLTHLVTGAGAVGIEIQKSLVSRARELRTRLGTERCAVVEGDATELTGYIAVGSVFFLYCPFSGARLERVLDDLERIAKTRPIRVCSVGLPLPARSWLESVAESDDIAVYRSIAPTAMQ